MPKRSVEETACAQLNHPYRARIVEVACQRDISPAQFVEARLWPGGFDFPSRERALTYSAYHFRKLAEAGCLDLVGEPRRRGAFEHIYRGTPGCLEVDEQFQTMPRGQREARSRRQLQGLVARAEGAMIAKTFDIRPDRRLSWAELELDARGWIELVAGMTGFVADVARISDGAQHRLVASGDTALAVTLGMLGFQSPPRAPRARG